MRGHLSLLHDSGYDREAFWSTPDIETKIQICKHSQVHGHTYSENDSRVLKKGSPKRLVARGPGPQVVLLC